MILVADDNFARPHYRGESNHRLNQWFDCDVMNEKSVEMKYSVSLKISESLC